MDDEQEVSIDEIKLWTVGRLKEFLKLRNLKVSGRKEELVALVFSAKTMPHLLPAAARPSSESKWEKYEDLLRVDGEMLPDPNTLTGWISEVNSIRQWPPTMAFDIGQYLHSIDNVDLRQRLISDYKDGKGYSYFASGWVKELEYHPVSEDSKVCLLRTECLPSQRVKNIPWKVWVAVVKSTGTVKSAYCTCFAGFSGTCNHIAAVLFKIDFAWRNGLTNPACTSQECGWAAFRSKHSVKPRRVSEMTWRKHLFSKQGPVRDDAGTNPPVRQLFSPLDSRSSGTRPSSSLSLLLQALYPDFQEAACFQYTSIHPQSTSTAIDPSSDMNIHHETEIEFSELPIPLPKLAQKSKSVEDFVANLPIYSLQTTSELERMTRGQVKSPSWLEHRKGRITSSVVHQVLTRGRRLLQRSGKSFDSAPLIRRILGYTMPSSDLPSLKYGREMEEEARNMYIKDMRRVGHAHFQVTECGLLVKEDQVYIGASADGLVSCSCCGDGTLEIKCPVSLSAVKPTSNNIPYVVEVNGKPALRQNHPYYSQVQLQMGLWKREWCDFFVYSRHGSLCIRVLFDEGRWQELLETCKAFFTLELAKELVTKDIWNSMTHED